MQYASVIIPICFILLSPLKHIECILSRIVTFDWLPLDSISVFISFVSPSFVSIQYCDCVHLNIFCEKEKCRRIFFTIASNWWLQNARYTVEMYAFNWQRSGILFLIRYLMDVTSIINPLFKIYNNKKKTCSIFNHSTVPNDSEILFERHWILYG